MHLPELGEFENDTAENRLKYTAFIVEASHNEQAELWAQYSGKGAIDYIFNCGHRKGESVYAKYHVNWEQIPQGWGVTVGYIYKRPVNISVQWARLNGQLVMFYYPTSRMVDYEMIDKWINKHFDKKYDKGTRRAATDAEGFSECLRVIKELNNEN